MRWINHMWQGQARLWKIFWGGLLLPYVLLFIFGFLKGILRKAIHLDAQPADPNTITLFLTICFIGWSIVVWKSGENTSHPAWKYLARSASILLTLSVVGVAVGKMNPAPLSDYDTSCIKAAQEFATKNGTDPQVYVENNRAYLDKCTNAVVERRCTGTMEEFATKNGLDPKEYVSHHWIYLKECVQSLRSHTDPNKPFTLPPPPLS